MCWQQRFWHFHLNFLIHGPESLPTPRPAWPGPFFSLCSKRDIELLLKLIANLNMLLRDENVNVVKKAILTMTQLYKVALQVRIIAAWPRHSVIWFGTGWWIQDWVAQENLKFPSPHLQLLLLGYGLYCQSWQTQACHERGLLLLWEQITRHQMLSSESTHLAFNKHSLRISTLKPSVRQVVQGQQWPGL